MASNNNETYWDDQAGMLVIPITGAKAGEKDVPPTEPADTGVVDKVVEAGKATYDAANFLAKGTAAVGAQVVSGLSGVGTYVGARLGGADPLAAARQAEVTVDTGQNKAMEVWGKIFGGAPISKTGQELVEFAMPGVQAFAQGGEEEKKIRYDFWTEKLGLGLGTVVATAPEAFMAVTDVLPKPRLPKPDVNQIVGGPSKIEPSRMLEGERLLEEGKSNYEVAQELGVWKGVDGNWRFWISDENAKLNATPEQLATIKKGKTITFAAEQILSHDLLYEAYPELKDVKVEFIRPTEKWKNDVGVNDGTLGFYDPDTGKVTIIIDDESLKNNKFLDTVVHEINHALQDVEDAGSRTYPTGISPSAVESIQTKAVFKNKKDMPPYSPVQLKNMIKVANAKGDFDKADTLETVYSALFDPDSGYLNQAGEREAFLSGNQVGKKVAPETAAALTAMGTATNKLNERVKDMRGFLEAHPNMWGDRELLRYMTRNKELIDEFAARTKGGEK